MPCDQSANKLYATTFFHSSTATTLLIQLLIQCFQSDKLSGYDLNRLSVQLNSFELDILLTWLHPQWLHSAQSGCCKAARETQHQCMMVKWTARHSAVTDPTTLQSSASIFPQASCALLPSLFCGGSSASSCLEKRIQVKHDFVA